MSLLMYLLLLTELLVGMMAIDPRISNGTCWYRDSLQADAAYIPCGNGALAFFTCCQAGDTCLSNNACYNAASGNTYFAGCTDMGYDAPTCPKKGSYNRQQWAGLVRCSPADAGRSSQGVWAPCEESIQPLVGRGNDCSCNTDDPGTAAFTAGAQLMATALLPQSIGGQIEYFVTLTDQVTSTSELQTTSIPQLTAKQPTTTTFITTQSSTTEPTTDTVGSSSTTGTSGTTTTPTSTSTPLSTNAKAGIGVSSGLAAIAIIALLAFIIHHLRRKGARKQTPEQNREADSYQDAKPPAELYTAPLVRPTSSTLPPYSTIMHPHNALLRPHTMLSSSLTVPTTIIPAPSQQDLRNSHISSTSIPNPLPYPVTPTIPTAMQFELPTVHEQNVVCDSPNPGHQRGPSGPRPYPSGHAAELWQYHAYRPTGGNDGDRDGERGTSRAGNVQYELAG